ncbi:MAG: ADOP family duplicated permease [Solirubrobacterales bacterium]
MMTLWQDIRYAVRMLRKSPGFTAIALITLAVAIGANTIVFSISDVLLFLQPQGIRNREQLAYCAFPDARYSFFRYAEYLTVRDSGLAFSDVIATAGPSRTTLVHGETARHVWASHVSSNYFSALGVVPVCGRGFLSEEEQQDCAPVVVLSYHWWQRLGGDSKILGEFLCVNGTDCRVVGVAPEGFAGVSLLGSDLWLPLGTYQRVSTQARFRSDQEPRLDVVGRLRPGLDISVAQAQLQTLFPQLKPACLERGLGGRPAFELRPPGRQELSGDSEGDRRWSAMVSLILMTPSAIILLIACLNLANMLIVQGTARHREIAVRLALGAGRWRIVRQLLIESGLLAVLGGALGLLPALCGTWILNALLAADESVRFDLNVRVLAGTLGLCLLTTLLFGLRPGLRLSKRDIAGEMKGALGRVTRAIGRTRGGFSLAAQIALAVALVLSATLLTRSALETARSDPGFSLKDKMVIELDPQSAGHDRAESIQVCEALADHLASLPEVKAVGTTTRLSYGGIEDGVVAEYLPGSDEDGESPPVARHAALVDIGRDYFEAMGIPLLQGRLFDRLDGVPNAEKVAIIDESLAHKLRPDGNALGCLIQSGWFTKADSDPYRVVGIVAHMPGIKDRQVRAQMYAPAEPNELSSCLYLRVLNKGSARAVRQRILQEIRRIDPRMPVLSLATLAEKRHADSWVRQARFGAGLALAAGASALFLAALGIYAIKGYMVASRTPEIGIRKALGATHGSIMGMVLREGFLVTTAGLIVGLLLGLAVAKVAASLLYGVSPIDPISIVVTVALLGAASLLASYIPARRAAKVDPMAALRWE